MLQEGCHLCLAQNPGLIRQLTEGALQHAWEEQKSMSCLSVVSVCSLFLLMEQATGGALQQAWEGQERV